MTTHIIASSMLPEAETPHLPAAFLEFCEIHKLDVRMYREVPVDTFPRFIRVSLLRRNELAATSPAGLGEPSSNAPALTDGELAALRSDLGASVTPVKWTDAGLGLCMLDGSVGISSSALYQAGLIHGIDISSAASVIALNPMPGDNILDMCCAPGAKLCLIAELMKTKGSLVGVDYSADRLGICASLLRKYKIVQTGKLQSGWRLQLFACDGRTFCNPAPLVPQFGGDAAAQSILQSLLRTPTDSSQKALGAGGYATDGSRSDGSGSIEGEEGFPEESKLPPIRSPPASVIAIGPAEPVFDSFFENAFRRAREQNRKGLARISNHAVLAAASRFIDSDAEMTALPEYDKVLVDAECTHDGSLRHIAKFGSSWGWDALHDHMTSDAKSTSLAALQRGLLQCAFNLVKVGGTVVYSTCSLTQTQNEEVVQWLLDNNANARIVPINDFAACAASDNDFSTALHEKPASADLREFFASLHLKSAAPTLEGSIPGTIRFDPLTSGTSGLFIARLTKSSV